MILSCGSVIVSWRHPMRTFCCGSPSISIDNVQLREQLERLHKEAESTRAKANSARMRLMRLSEAAEKLRHQASVSIHIGKENDARDLLFQKKKVMQALEKSKIRIELLDELAAKLGEAISVKERQLIENVAINHETASSDPSPVRIVPPNQEETKNHVDNQELDRTSQEYAEVQKLQAAAQNQAGLHIPNEIFNGKEWDEADILHSLKDVTSYEDFLTHLDQQFNKIEAELLIFLKLSKLILENKETGEYSKVRLALEILDSVRHLRGRITSMKESKLDVR